MLIKIIFQFFKKINLKFFLIFIIVSSFFWTITKFSNIYKFKNDFDINWTNVPEKIIVKNEQKKISLLFSASGFEILLYKFFKNKIKISLDKDVVYENNIALVNINNKIFEIEKQLFDNNIIEDLISKKISFNYSTFIERENV